MIAKIPMKWAELNCPFARKRLKGPKLNGSGLRATPSEVDR